MVIRGGIGLRIRGFYSKVGFLLLIILVLYLFYFKSLTNLNVIEKVVTPEPLKYNPGFKEIENNLLVSDEDGSNEYEQMILADLRKQEPGLGENGRIAHLKSPYDEIGEKQLAVIALNEELSEHISYNRTIPDARHPACKRIVYDTTDLPTTSVIVIFFNEPYSVLVRTVHSVLNTSPAHLLKEVIIVDDASGNIELKGKLDHYIKTRFPTKVKILRLKNR